MRKDIRVAGSGGQGVIMMTLLMANAYGLYEGLEIAQTQSYGAAARGGACQAGLVVSDRSIDYVELEQADIFVAFNEASFKAFMPKTKPDAVVFVDSTYIPEADYSSLPNTVHSIEATRLAESAYAPFMANVVMLGYVAAKLGDIKYDTLVRVIREKLPDKLQEMNLAAFNAGYERGMA